MKNLTFLFLGFVLISCDAINTGGEEKVEVIEALKQSEIDSVKNVVIDSFQDVFSDMDTSSLDKHYTKDFILLENGVVWTKDTITNYLRRRLDRATGDEAERVNRFEFIKAVHHKTSVWLAYDNYAVWVRGEDTLRNAHWLESVVGIKENGKWKLEQMHSTYVRE